MFTVRRALSSSPVSAADANEDANFPKIINFFAAEPELARELFAGSVWVIWFAKGDRREVAT
jgi:hypothetical protein